MEIVDIEKLVHGGQGLGTLPDGRKVFVWNALPGERVAVRLIKQKRSYAEAIAEEIMVASPDRVDPVEANYLATSPWQMMTFAAENRYKAEIVRELFTQASLTVTSGKAAGDGEFISPPREMENPHGVFHYRNKMEYSFWGDEDGLRLALHQRGSHGKHIVQGSALALPAVDVAANVVLEELRRLKVRAGDLKTVIVRTDQQGSSTASLFVKPSEFPRLKLPSQVKNTLHQDGPSEALKGLRGKLFGDKGYLSKEVFEQLWSQGLQLVTNIRRNMKQRLLPLWDKLMLRKRFIIETVNDHLKNNEQIEHSRHRSLTNFSVNLLSGLIAYQLQPKKPQIRVPKMLLLEA